MSFSIRNTLTLGALSALTAAQTTPPKLDAACADVVIFMARGNDAPYHDGRTFPFVEATCGKLRAEGKTCDYIDVQYDVTLGGDYCAQVAEGARNGISQITAFNQKCPCSHIVVNGYSEGAHVMGDVLGGPGGCTFVSNGLDNTSSAGKAIAAALLWGDVMHTANQPYNVLNGATMQKNPRSASDLARLNRYAPVLRSYCAAGDPVCAGGNVVADHLNYFELYTDEASSWVVNKINNVAPLPSCGASTVPTPTASVSATATGGGPIASEIATATGGGPIASEIATATGGGPIASEIATATGGGPVASEIATATGGGPIASEIATATGGGPIASEIATATGGGPIASEIATATGGAPAASAPANVYPVSPVVVAPFPRPIAYDSCVLEVHVEYCYE